MVSRRTLSGQLRNIRKDVAGQPSNPELSPSQFKKLVRKESVEQPVRRERHNFFAHKSELEAFGDEGLTFFDSQKATRSGKNTGDLFGI